MKHLTNKQRLKLMWDGKDDPHTHSSLAGKEIMQRMYDNNKVRATRISGYPPNTISGSRAPQLMCLTSKLSSFQGESEFIGVQERN